MCAPACEASGDSDATIPPREMTIDRACPRPCGVCAILGTLATNSSAQPTKHRVFIPLFSQVSRGTTTRGGNIHCRVLFRQASLSLFQNLFLRQEKPASD